MNTMDLIVESTRNRVEKDKAAGLPKRTCRDRSPLLFEQCLKSVDVSFICEVKRTSPSKGILADDFPYTDIALEYEEAGADAVSVLTEPDFFGGSDHHLAEIRERTDIPLLRKDFIIDSFQIEQSCLLGADAILLICTILSFKQLSTFIRSADDLGISCLVETHNEEEIKMALQANARVIGVNNRNLKNFDVNIGNSIALRKYIPNGLTFVSESGIRTNEDVHLLWKNGVDAVLIGETLMRSKDKKASLSALKDYKWGV